MAFSAKRYSSRRASLLKQRNEKDAKDRKHAIARLSAQLEAVIDKEIKEELELLLEYDTKVARAKAKKTSIRIVHESIPPVSEIQARGLCQEVSKIIKEKYKAAGWTVVKQQLKNTESRYVLALKK